MSTSEQIIDCITRYKQARAYDLRQALGISSVAVHKQLRKLVRLGKLKKIGTPPLVLYVLPETEEKNLIRLEKIKRKVLPILKKADVKKAALFGSYVRGEETQKSDIDILVDLPDNATLIDLVGIKQDIEEKLHKKVDVVEYQGLKSRIKKSILAEQFPIL